MHPPTNLMIVFLCFRMSHGSPVPQDKGQPFCLMLTLYKLDPKRLLSFVSTRPAKLQATHLPTFCETLLVATQQPFSLSFHAGRTPVS
jgi:hypothetical protein